MKKMVPSWWCVHSKRTIVPERGGVAKEERRFLFTTRGEMPLGLDGQICFQQIWTTHKTYGMGASGAAHGESCSPVDPSRTPRVPAWPGNIADTDVQTRDCARFKDRRPLGRKSTTMMSDPPLWPGPCLRRRRWTGIGVGAGLVCDSVGVLVLGVGPRGAE